MLSGMAEIMRNNVLSADSLSIEARLGEAERHDMLDHETGITGIILSVCLIVFRVSFIIK